MNSTIEEVIKIVGPLSYEQRRKLEIAIASYAMASNMDSSVRKEALDICSKDN